MIETPSDKLTTGQRRWLRRLVKQAVSYDELPQNDSARSLNNLVSKGYARYSVQYRRWSVTAAGQAKVLRMRS